MDVVENLTAEWLAERERAKKAEARVAELEAERDEARARVAELVESEENAWQKVAHLRVELQTVDRLRRSVSELERERDALRKRVAELESKIANDACVDAINECFRLADGKPEWDYPGQVVHLVRSLLEDRARVAELESLQT